jgi:hypothetical protein
MLIGFLKPIVSGKMAYHAVNRTVWLRTIGSECVLFARCGSYFFCFLHPERLSDCLF